MVFPKSSLCCRSEPKTSSGAVFPVLFRFVAKKAVISIHDGGRAPTVNARPRVTSGYLPLGHGHPSPSPSGKSEEGRTRLALARSSLDRASPDQRPSERELVGVLEVGADRQTAREPGNRHSGVELAQPGGNV